VPAAGEAAAPCAACVTWRATPVVLEELLAAPGRLDGLDVLVAVETAADAARAAPAARALAARGGAVSFELPLPAVADDLAELAPLAARILLRVPADAAVDDALVFAIRTRATAVRAAAPAAAIGLFGPAGVLRAVAGGIGPYVSFLVPDSAPPDTAGGFEWWLSGAPATSLADLLAATERAAGRRLLVGLRDGDGAVAREAAALSDVLPAGLTTLDGVTVCAGEPACATRVYLHPGTLEAVAVVEDGGPLTVRPGATRAFARALHAGGDRALPLTTRDGQTEIDARGLVGPFVLRLAGWAGGEAGFTAGVEVTAARALTVEEILAAHQAAAARQAGRVRTVLATGTSVLTFQVPGLAAPMTVTAGAFLYRDGALAEIEQRDLRLNGVPVGVGEDGVPRLPLVQPERVASPPLSITLGEAYRYRLEGEEETAGRACYVVAFQPRDAGRPSQRGRAWIAKVGFALVRLEATQTGLRGAIVSSAQTDEFRPVDVQGEEQWLLARSDVEQMYEGPGHRTPIHRVVTFDRIEVNPPDFEARRAAARASRTVMMRETPDGFRYLRRVEEPAAPGGRTLAGRATRVWSVAAGALFDPNIDRPLPFAGLSYLDFDLLGTGAQMNAFLAGPFAQVAVSVPSVGGAGLQIQASAFASLARYNDRSFRAGVERYDENLRQRPLRASVAALRRLGSRLRLRAAYELDALDLEANDTTAADFRVPASPVAHGLRLGLEWERGAWSATAWGTAARRQRWREWGRPGDYAADARAYQRAGMTAARSFVLGPRAVARLEASALAGRDLDRFSRFTFDAFDNRLRGYPSAGVRFDRGLVLRTAATWAGGRGWRLDGFVDAAVVRDPAAGRGGQGHLGTGAAAEVALPGRILLDVDWGYGFQARDRDGRRGTHTVRVTAYKIV
jgi:hypothetical protein